MAKGGAKDVGIEMDYDQARELVYGMTYDEWKNNHQEKATQEQLDKYNALKPDQITE